MTHGNPVFGLDLTFTSHPTAYALLDAEPEVKELGFLDDDQAILEVAERARPTLVAIDAPLSLPGGLCCLETTCPCQPASPQAGRLCERELAQLGIGCFFTTKRSIIKPLVSRGIALKEELEAQGYPVIEVYPYATKRILWRGEKMPKKTSADGRHFLNERLRKLIPLPDGANLSHDKCDAILAAYTGHLHRLGKTRALGEPLEGVIVVPDGLG